MHVLGLLRQRCQWRRWLHARTERIGALTVLRGTRAVAKLGRQLELAVAEVCVTTV